MDEDQSRTTNKSILIVVPLENVIFIFPFVYGINIILPRLSKEEMMRKHVGNITYNLTLIIFSNGERDTKKILEL